MPLRQALVVVSVALLAVPVAGAAKSKSHVVAAAKGKVSWTIPLPNAFGVEVVSDPLAFKPESARTARPEVISSTARSPAATSSCSLVT